MPVRGERLALMLCIVVVAAMLLPRPGDCDTPVVALLTAMQGKVSLRRTGVGAFKPAELLSEIRAGDAVRLAAGASSTLSFASGGVRVYLSGPAEVVVSEHGVSPLSAQVRVVQPQSRQGLALPAGVNIQRMMATSLSRGQKPQESPVITLLTRHVTLADAPVCWYTNVDGTPTVRVYRSETQVGDPKSALFVSHDVSPEARSLSLPPGTLQPGQDAYLEISMQNGSEVITDGQIVHVMSNDEASSIHAAEAAAQREMADSPGDATPRILLIYRYLDAQLDARALPLARELESSSPHHEPVVRLLIHIYERVGMNYQADELARSLVNKAAPSP
jgi:hypothetical protein